ncbi:MAG: hypothetical protein MJE68_32390 [Proteobacteria bacterium]|nr:hypothetical protein [Pseudomonadota bacterium]
MHELCEVGATINSSLEQINTDTVRAFPCNWRIITFECTVDGGTSGGSTVWTGTAFSGCDDTNEEIVLLHSRFSGETDSIQCNTSHITFTGRSIRIENNSYISQLEVLVKPGLDEMPLKNVTCAHDNGTKAIVVDSITINTFYICTSSEDLLNDSAAINYTTISAMEGI